MAENDLVVVLPGIMGSTLERNGTPVWAPSAGAIVRAVASFGRRIKELQLPDGIGDDPPGDGVTAGALMPDLHALPGVWTPVRGYTALVERLEKIGYRSSSDDPAAPPGNLLLFPYDWRLSNRYNGIELGKAVEAALDRWRKQGGEYADAQVCFVCHSMGGLVARWYLAHGGSELTRKLITLGTPHRGAARAVDQLVHGVHKGIGPLSINLTDFARSLPSLHQLLPSYACVSVGADLAPLTGLPGIDTNRLNDALHFYQQLEAIEASDTGSASRRHLITGSRQRTASTVTISNGVVRLLDSYQGDDLAGDGTVPTVSLPFGLPLDDNTIHHIADKHGDLQCNPAVLDEIEAILLAKSIVPKALALAELRVDAPDLLLAGQDLVVTVNECRRPVTVTLTDEHGDPTVQLPRPDGAGGLVSVFHALPPGGYTLTAAGRMPGLVSPVTSDLVVWPPDLGTAPLG